jgi:DNA-binding CsgD family transcriptional regulator
MMQTIPLTLQSPYPAFQKKIRDRKGRTNYRRIDHTEIQLTDFLNICSELQETINSIQGLVRMLPDCTMSNSGSREKVASLLNKIIEIKSEMMGSQISNILKIFNESHMQTGAEPEKSYEYAIEGPYPVVKDKALTVGMDDEDLKRFNSISSHIGISPSILAHIILKQAIVKARDRKHFKEFFLSPEKPSSKAPRLFRRESDVLQLMSRGYSNKEIADNLNISERTVKNHITSLMRKLNAQNRTHAVITAQQYHLV